MGLWKGLNELIHVRCLDWYLVCVKSYIMVNHSEGHQPWDFFGRNDAEAETPVLWPPHVKS